MLGSDAAFEKAMNDGHSAAWDQEWTRAATAYRQALKVIPNEPKAFSSLGLALFQSGEFDEALQVFKRAAEISHDDPIPLEKVSMLSERAGDLQTAIEFGLRAADLFLNQRDVDKAIENWARITKLSPDHALAHSRLAQVHERLGHTRQAVTEYLAVASLVQRAGNTEKTREIIGKALVLMPDSREARQAQTLLQGGELLPRPRAYQRDSVPLPAAPVREQPPRRSPVSANLDPVAEARQKAVATLAELLFEYSDESAVARERRGMAAIVRGTGTLSLQQTEQTRVVLYISQAIEAQSAGKESQAIEELERALDSGFKHPALYFVLGLLRVGAERLESALRVLQHSLKHQDYALATRLLLGQILTRKGQVKAAAQEYLEALRLADSTTVDPAQATEIGQLYEPLIESQQEQSDATAALRLCETIQALLMRPDWRDQLGRIREQMPRSDGGLAVPVAEVITQTQSSAVLTSMSRVNQLARLGKMRAAMDEAFDALRAAPSYLPLHTLMGDLLAQEGHTQDAIAKYGVTAHAYDVRGEMEQANKLLRRVLQLSPMDLAARNRLIEQLVARGQIDEAIQEHLELAEIYYRLADLDMARKTYATALRVMQHGNADRAWDAHILQRMADIDLQRLDWKQALRIFEQIRLIRPDDEGVRRQIVEINLRMGQQAQAMGELENYLAYLEGNQQAQQAVRFLEELIKDHDDQLVLKRTLAELLHRAGRTDQAIQNLDTLGESLLGAGKKSEAVEVINQIISMHPPNSAEYRRLLDQIQGG